MGMTDPGAYAEYVAWPASSLVRLPDRISYLAASLAEPLGVAIHAANLVPLEGRSVFIAGAGPIGLLTVVAARARGAATVIVSDIDAARLEVARAVGADHVVHAGEGDPAAAARELTGGSGVDVAFEAVGATEPVRQTTRCHAQRRHRGVDRQQRRADRAQHADRRHARPHDPGRLWPRAR